MSLDVEEKKILYAFGCRDYQSTVCRLKWIASLTVDIKVKQKILYLTRKLKNAGDGEWYACFYHQLCMEMKEYFEAKKRIRMIEKIRTENG